MEVVGEFGLLIPLLFIVAVLYSSVGHGGASGYLALLGLWGFSTGVMRPTALVLNLMVAGISFISFYRAGYFKSRLFWPFALASVPCSFLGGMIELNTSIYKVILGMLLVFATLRMLGIFTQESGQIEKIPIIPALVIGALIGFFSGLIGMGGGVILSPIILLMRWGGVKETAAASALFIWVNSLAGLLGQWNGGVELVPSSWLLLIVALAGGIIGGYAGSFRLNHIYVRRLLAFVLIVASVKLIFI